MLCSHSSLLKLFIKPNSLLLEARRSQTSSKEHNQTSALQLFFDLVFVDLHDEKITKFIKFEDKSFKNFRKDPLKLHGVICFCSSRVVVREMF